MLGLSSGVYIHSKGRGYGYRLVTLVIQVGMLWCPAEMFVLLVYERAFPQTRVLVHLLLASECSLFLRKKKTALQY